MTEVQTMTATPTIDLGALRAAALSSKKRKRDKPTDGAAADEELEEGEITDDEDAMAIDKPIPIVKVPIAGPYKPLSLPPTGPKRALPAKPPPSIGKSAPRPAVKLPPTPAIKPAAIPGPPTFAPQLADRDPCRVMIQQLVSWGVTPEYLVGYGIAKETVALAFVELGFRLPPHLEYLVAPALHILSTVAPANASPSTSQIALPNGAGTTTPDQALIDMEKKRREELMARRTKRTAVEASIESLFSAAATTSADANGTTSGSRAGSATNSPPEMAIDDLRETIAAADELNPAPNGGPYASSALSPTTSLPTRSLPRRPVAVDFEADPTHAAASFVPPSRSTGFAPPPEMHRMQPLFLDLSDDEAEEDAEVAHTLAPTASTSMSEVVSKGERESLEAKEAEIKRMTEMITRMEKKAKKKVPPTLVATIEGGDAVMQDAAAAAATSSVPPTAALQEARSQVERLEGERQQLIDEVERRAASSPGKPDNTAHPRQSMAVDSVEPTTLFTYTPSDYLDYHSPFYDYPAVRSEPLSPQLSPIAQAGRPTLASVARRSILAFTARQRDVEAKRKLCKYEMEGVCNDSDCKSYHVSSFEPDESTIAAWIRATFHLDADASAERIALFQRGLDLLVDRHKTDGRVQLDDLYRAAYDYLKSVKADTSA